jgi:RNA polymerase sigma factor (TIGR02999 family)
MQSSPSQVTALLDRWKDGDPEALDLLVTRVYTRLRALAHCRLRAEPEEHSLNTTALVHEAYLRLTRTTPVHLRDRAHFFALFTRIMRNLLVDQARARHAAKRGGKLVRVTVDSALELPGEQLDAVEALHEALARLEQLDPRQSALVEQRYFGGLSLEESAEALGVSLATVKRDLRSARAWLALEIGSGSVFGGP